MFREYLQTLRENHQLIDVDRTVELDYELAAVTQAMLEQDRPMAMFRNVNHPSNIPVVGGLLGSMRRIALALGVEPQDISARLEHALNNLIEPQVVEKAPFQENVVLGDDINLRELLPIPWHNRGDAGPYVTAGLMIGRDPDTGRHNYSYNRLQITGPRKTGINMNAWRHLAYFYETAEQRNEPLPVAVVIGVDPTVEIAAGFRIEEDEAMLAGAIRGKALPVCKSSALGILVPADAEIVLEGHLLPHRREPEGPLAEFTGHFGEVYQNPVFEVSAVSYRNNPIYRTLIPGTFEHIYIGNVLPREITLKNMTRYVSPNVKGVHLAPYASGFMAIVSIDKKNQGEPKNIALAALTSHVNIKAAVVVDTDVDIYQPSDILFAMATRVDARRDIVTIPYAQGMENDPTTDAQGMQSKYAVDATLDLAIKSDYQRVRYPAVDLEEFFGKH